MLRIAQRIADYTHISVRRVLAYGFGGFFSAGAGMVGVGEYLFALIPWLVCALILALFLWPKSQQTHAGVRGARAVACGLLFFACLFIWVIAKRGADPWTNFARLHWRNHGAPSSLPTVVSTPSVEPKSAAPRPSAPIERAPDREASKSTGRGATPSRPVELEGNLVPANDPTPPNECQGVLSRVPAGGVTLLAGTLAAYTTHTPVVVLRVGGRDAVEVDRGANGRVALTARVFGDDGRIVALVERNRFTINPNNYFRRELTSHELRVWDQGNREVLNVRYMNKDTIRVTGIFATAHPGQPLIVTSDSITNPAYPNFRVSNVCFAEPVGNVMFDLFGPPKQR